MKVAGDSSPVTVKERRLRGPRGQSLPPLLSVTGSATPLVDEAIALFGPRYGRAIGREEARQMIERLTAFFDLLAEWEQRAQSGPVEGEVAA